MLVRGAIGALARPGLRKNFRDDMQYYEPEYSQFMRTGSTSEPEQSAVIITGPSRLYSLGDGEPITYEDPKIGPKVLAVDQEFGLGIIITKRAIEDDQYGKVKNAGKWLARSVQMTYEYAAGGLLDDAFAGTTYKGYDGLSLINTAHTLIGTNSTFANRPTLEVGLSVAGITALLDLAAHAVDQNGDPIQVKPSLMVIGNRAGDYSRALQIWHSQYEPFTSDNQENALRLRMKARNGYMPTKEPIISHYKTNEKSYFLVDSNLNDVHFLIRRPATMEDEEDFDTGAFKSKVTTRFLQWIVDPIGWYGSNPS